jgi:hypothetical protein
VLTSAGALPPADAINCQTVQGATLWYSFKTSCTPVAVALGTCDGEIQAIAAAMPSGSFLTYFHEPEDDMTGVLFVNAFKHVYQQAKAVNTAINIVPLYMSYQFAAGLHNGHQQRNRRRHGHPRLPLPGHPHLPDLADLARFPGPSATGNTTTGTWARRPPHRVATPTQTA